MGATDRSGASSPFSAEQSFTVTLPGETTCCETDGGCQSSRGPGPGSLLGLGFVALLVRRRRR